MIKNFLNLNFQKFILNIIINNILYIYKFIF